MSSGSSAALTFRRASLLDMARIAEHVQCAYRGASGRVGWTTESDLLDGQRTDAQELRELLCSQEAQLWLVEGPATPASGHAPGPDASELLGSVVIRREPVGVMHLGMLAVRPDQQAQGIGRALLELAERLAVELGWGDRIEMTVIAQRPELIAWYERRGYRVTGERRPFPYGDARFGLPRRSDLYFCVLEKRLS